MSQSSGPLRTWMPLVARLLVGGTFVWLGYAKTADPIAFLKAVRSYGLIDDASPLLNAMGALLPWVEITCGALLVLGVGVRGNALILLTLLLVFTPAIVLRAMEIAAERNIALWHVEFDCGCGTGVERVTKKIPENAALALFAGLLVFFPGRRFALRRDLL